MSDPDLWPHVLSRLAAHEALSSEEAAEAMRQVMAGEATAGQIGGFLMALRTKGETVDEIEGLARTMLDFATPVRTPGPVVDVVGTGGDRSGTFNISTVSAIVAAGAGVAVAKHGNRAASSHCGSADTLEALGVTIDLDAAGAALRAGRGRLGRADAPAHGRGPRPPRDTGQAVPRQGRHGRAHHDGPLTRVRRARRAGRRDDAGSRGPRASQGASGRPGGGGTGR